MVIGPIVFHRMQPVMEFSLIVSTEHGSRCIRNRNTCQEVFLGD